MGDRVILHSDINSCYASIELLHHPELKGKPVAVGGDPEARHGIVLTADYVAKKYGVKTGMALWQAKQVCPDITFLPPRMDLYLRFSRMAHEIYGEYTDLQEPYGIDESWLDVTDSAGIKGDGYRLFRESYRWHKPIRSVGIRGADLVTDNYWEQLDLFHDVGMRNKMMRADKAVDEIRRRFGFYSVQRGLMLGDNVLSKVNAKEEHTVHPHGYFGQ
jgi:hypothetical protein